MSADTASRLVDVAARLIHFHGYAATGVARILEEAGAGSGSLYHFYPTKEHLLTAVLSRYRERLEEEIFGPVRESSDDPVERVFGVLAFYRRFLEATHCSLGCPIGNLAGEVSDGYPSIRSEIEGIFSMWRTGIRQFVEQARGRLPKDTDLDALATLVLSVMEGGVMQARVARSLEPFDQSTTMLRDYFDRLEDSALAGEPRKSPGRRSPSRKRKRS
jgi:TetR/AcrR family transcriptional regulator, transcriptional repressor for nem operon